MRTTKKDFKHFKQCLKHYYKKYHLSGWHVYYSHETCDGLAQMVPDIRVRAVNFILDPKWVGVKVTRKKLKRTAKHEMAHLILEPLMSVAVNRYTLKDNLSAASEEVSQHLTELL